jgi:dynein heavy chain
VLYLVAEKKNLQPNRYFVADRLVELFETICARHGLMVVGSTGGGKRRERMFLKEALADPSGKGTK